MSTERSGFQSTNEISFGVFTVKSITAECGIKIVLVFERHFRKKRKLRVKEGRETMISRKLEAIENRQLKMEAVREYLGYLFEPHDTLPFSQFVDVAKMNYIKRKVKQQPYEDHSVDLSELF